MLCPPPGDLPDSRTEPICLTSPAWARRFFTNEHRPGSPLGVVSVVGIWELSVWQVLFSSTPREGGWFDCCRSGDFQASTLEGEGHGNGAPSQLTTESNMVENRSESK